MDRQAESVSTFGVVAIGASAGGIAALPAVLSALPDDYPAAVVIVLHLDPHHHSTLASLLARTSALPVQEARSGDLLQAATVYVAPPGSHLVLQGGVLMLSDAAPVNFSRPAVDVLFRSVAEACGPRAIGVILTGAGRDGATGLQAIKRAGGRTIVQDPESAAHGSMPAAAAATGCADFTLPLASIGPMLADLVATPRAPAADFLNG
jgi:two-component system, chemotaxis family, protein-glutamate methylesterase/glutaminase